MACVLNTGGSKHTLRGYCVRNASAYNASCKADTESNNENQHIKRQLQSEYC